MPQLNFPSNLSNIPFSTILLQRCLAIMRKSIIIGILSIVTMIQIETNTG